MYAKKRHEINNRRLMEYEINNPNLKDNFHSGSFSSLDVFQLGRICLII